MFSLILLRLYLRLNPVLICLTVVGASLFVDFVGAGGDRCVGRRRVRLLDLLRRCRLGRRGVRVGVNFIVGMRVGRGWVRLRVRVLGVLVSVAYVLRMVGS